MIRQASFRSAVHKSLPRLVDADAVEAFAGIALTRLKPRLLQANPGTSLCKAILSLLALLVTLSAAPALAHGGGTPQLVQAPAGPYWVYAWTNPTPVRIGTLHVTVALTDPATDEPILDVPVEVILTPGDGGAPVSAQATHEKATIKSYYETDLELPTEGDWQATISFQSPQGPGEASFPIDVQPQSFSRWLLIGVGGVVVVVAGWFFWPKKARD